MGLVATSVDKQIEILESRGMILDLDKTKIKEILLDIGYYRLGFYWNPFEVNELHDFMENTKFSDVVELYYLDVDLRNLLLKYINRIEVNFRTKVVYYGSIINRKSATWFIDSDIMKKEFILSIHEHYDKDFIGRNKVIKKHHDKYKNDKYAPAWKAFEFMTFGSILKILKNLKADDVRKRISDEYKIINLKKFINLIETVVFVRNTCAHGAVLFDLKTPKGISVIPELNFIDNERHSLDSAIKVILYLLGHISENRKNEMNEQLNSLFNKYIDNHVVNDIIEKKIGYKFQ